MQYWKLQDHGDRVPYGVAAKDDEGLPRLFVPGVGLVHMPSVADVTHNGEVGGQPITEAAAKRLMKARVCRMSLSDVASLRGPAPTIPAGS